MIKQIKVERKINVMESNELKMASFGTTVVSVEAIKQIRCSNLKSHHRTNVVKVEHRKSKSTRNIHTQESFLTFRPLTCHLSRKMTFWLLLLIATVIENTLAENIEGMQKQSKAVGADMKASLARFSPPIKYDDEENFRPIIPKDPEYISRNIFTSEGKYRVFEPVESDLRLAVAKQRLSNFNERFQYSTKTTRKSFPVSKNPNALIRDESILNLTNHPSIPTSQPLSLLNASTTAKPKSPLLEETINELAWSLVNNTKSKIILSSTPIPVLSTDSSEEFSLGTAEVIEVDTHSTINYNEEETSSEEEPNGREEVDNDDSTNNAVLPEISESLSIQNSKDSSSDNSETVGEGIREDLRGLEDLLIDYVENFFSKGKYEPLPGLVIELQKNQTNSRMPKNVSSSRQSKLNAIPGQALGKRLKRHIRGAMSTGRMKMDLPKVMQSGRLLFATGLKKLMVPIWMGLNVLKSVLLAMFIPAIIGTFSKMLGKGISSGSAPLFIRPMDTPQELDFRDNNLNFDDEKFILSEDSTKDAGYSYNQAEASQQQNQYAYSPNSINHLALSRYGNNEKQQNVMQDSYLGALQSISSASFKNSQSLSSGSSSGLGGLAAAAGGGAPSRNKPASPANMNTFQTFQKVPSSALLLSNYDPFYSPLLSRLDSVFAQLKLSSENEECREKLICLMYSNPAKYAPYSNLVSAQLSRELNELRKPTSDNPDILRFFKYMRAAKDGQDGTDCEKTFDKCKEFKDFDNPAMLSTYNDINKLVQARKFSS